MSVEAQNFPHNGHGKYVFHGEMSKGAEKEKEGAHGVVGEKMSLVRWSWEGLVLRCSLPCL
jgi:hypothetical protein